MCARRSVGVKRLYNSTAHRNDFVGDAGVAGVAAGFVDGSEQVEELAADGGVGFERQAVKRQCDVVRRAAGGEVLEVVAEFEVADSVDGDVGVPFGVVCSRWRSAASAVADGIAVELQRDSADVAD